MTRSSLPSQSSSRSRAVASRLFAGLGSKALPVHRAQYATLRVLAPVLMALFVAGGTPVPAQAAQPNQVVTEIPLSLGPSEAPQAEIKYETQASPFAWRAPLDGPTTGSFYRVPIPMQVYETAHRADLGDLRVYNARGIEMPYAWVDNDQAVQNPMLDMAVRVIPLRGAPQQNVNQRLAMSVERAEDQSIARITVDGGPGRGRTEIGSVLDLSNIVGEIHALVFDDYETDTKVHAFSLEASDDLQSWRTLRQEAHIVRLAQAGQVVQQNRVELAPIEASSLRYLRLRWHDPASAPSLGKVSVRLSKQSTPPRSLVWTEPQSPVSGQDRDFEYRAPAALPIERLRVNLPRANILAPVRIYGPDTAAAAATTAAASSPDGGGPTPTAPTQSEGNTSAATTEAAAAQPMNWTLKAHAVAFRMQADVGEIVAPDVLLPGGPMPQFRVILDATERLGGTPTVQLGFAPKALIFAAQQPGPFVLAWGADTVVNGAIPMSELALGQSAEHLISASETVYAMRREPAGDMTISVPIVPEPPSRLAWVTENEGWKSAALTGLLVVVDLLLALLAWRSYRRMRRAGRMS